MPEVAGQRTVRSTGCLGPGFVLSALVGLGMLFASLIMMAYENATAAPLVRRLVLRVPGYPRAAAPLRIVLFSDLHVHGPDMPPTRVARIVDQINALQADVVVAAGDFVGDNWVGAHYPIEEALAPLRGLKAKLGVYAVLGNNDYDVGAAEVMRVLRSEGIRVLMNQAQVVGPLALGGMDGRIYRTRAAWDARRHRTVEALEDTPGVQVLLVHRPDEFNWAGKSVSLVLAGHTHCGQIVLPLVGPLETGSDFGERYLCGVVRNGAKTLVVTAGLGTSHIPLRLGAPPDVWVISIRG